MAGEEVISSVVDEKSAEPETTTAQSTSEVVAPAPAATAPEGEAPEKKPGRVPDSLKPKPTDSETFRTRLSDLVAARKMADEENRRLRDELGRFRQATREEERQSAKADGPPKEEDFESYKEFILAAATYAQKQEHAKQQEAAKAQQTQEEQQRYRAQKRQEFEQHAAAIVTEVPEFWEAVTDPNLPVSEAMADAVMELGELAPFAMLWLAANRQESMKMSRLPPHVAALAIGRLAERLEKDIRTAQEERSNGSEHPSTNGSVNRLAVPKPVPTIRGGAPGNMNGEPTDRDDARTWAIKEADRMRKKFGNPNLRVYVPR